ncbi:VanZ family protein [Rothia terrae]|uniref:VanZ family protein n=1 Tax=Rothia terrae TaxID=396015 RepID=UPI002881095C|nr:VanZ family protein [Rothia terrae]MDT0189479.1 VanZ family protein [Rothia terrae]
MAASLPRPQKMLHLALSLYAIALVFVVFWPAHVDDNAAGGALVDFIDRGRAEGFLPGWVDYSSIEWLSNVVMFVPFGFLLFFVLPARLRFIAAVCGFCASAFIESVQFFMPERTSSWWDIMANTLGALVGVLLAWVLNSLRTRVKKQHNPRKTQPRKG